MLSRDEYLVAWSRWHGDADPADSRLVHGWLTLAYTLAVPLARLPPLVATALGLLVAGAAVGPAAAGGAWLIAAGVLIGLSGLLDSLDGALAIAGGRASRRGFVLDSAVDRLTEVAYAAALLGRRGARVAGRRVRRAVLAAGLPAGPGRAGRGARDRRDLGVGAADPGGDGRVHPGRRRGRRRGRGPGRRRHRRRGRRLPARCGRHRAARGAAAPGAGRPGPPNPGDARRAPVPAGFYACCAPVPLRPGSQRPCLPSYLRRVASPCPSS